MDFNSMVQTQLYGQKIQVSISYCEEDTAEAERLIDVLNFLKEKIIIWSPLSIKGGDTIEKEIRKNFNHSPIILVLISTDYFSCNKINSLNRLDVQRKIIIEKIENKRGVIVPIILKSTLTQYTEFSEIQHLPAGNIPISNWMNRDDAWTDVCDSINRIIENQNLPQITINALKDFFREETSFFPKNTKSMYLFPILQDTDNTFVKPAFFDYMCLSLRESSHVILLNGLIRSGKSLVLNKAIKHIGLEEKCGYRKYSCINFQERSKLIHDLAFVQQGIIIIEDFDFLNPAEKKVITEYALNVMNSNKEVMLVVVSRLKLEDLLSDLIKDPKNYGLYDQYKIDAFTYDSNQVLKMFSGIEKRFNITIDSQVEEELFRCSIDSIFIARCLWYEILKNCVDTEFYPKVFSFEDEVTRLFNRMDANQSFLKFRQIEDTFMKDINKTYSNIFTLILNRISEVGSQGFVSIRKLVKKAVIKFDDKELKIFTQYLEGHISEISYTYPGFFDYEKNIQQVSISNVEFLFYLKNKHRISSSC
jgi:TIR domain